MERGVYKGANRFMQRVTRSDFGLRERLGGGKKKLPPKKVPPKPADKGAASRAEARTAAGVGTPYAGGVREVALTARSSVEGGYARLAEELNRREVPNAVGEAWTPKQVKCLFEAYETGVWRSPAMRSNRKKRP